MPRYLLIIHHLVAHQLALLRIIIPESYLWRCLSMSNTCTSESVGRRERESCTVDFGSLKETYWGLDFVILWWLVFQNSFICSEILLWNCVRKDYYCRVSPRTNKNKLIASFTLKDAIIVCRIKADIVQSASSCQSAVSNGILRSV